MLSSVPGFRGVFSSDQLPNKPNMIESGVMNFDVANNPGTHWVAWICNKGFTVYFDSFGVPIPDSLRIYLSKHKSKNHFTNSGMIQSYDSVLCGYYCVDFIKSCHNSSLEEIVGWLNKYWPDSRVVSNEDTIKNRIV